MTPLIAATATQDMPIPWGRFIGYATLALLVWFLGYVAACRWRPWAHCLCCKGNARHYRKDGKAFRDCWWCRRSPGRRMRIGRRAWNRFAKVRKAAS